MREEEIFFFIEICSFIPTTYLNGFLFYIFPEFILRGILFQSFLYITLESPLFDDLIGNHVKTILI